MNLDHGLKAYSFPVLLIFSIFSGALFGIYFNKYAYYLKPLGDIFLNLIFTCIVPLVFFSVSSAIARAGSIVKMGKIIFYMLLIFIITGFIAAFCTLILVKLFPLGQGISILLPNLEKKASLDFYSQFTKIFTVSDFSLILNHNNVLPLIVFSILLGFAVLSLKEKRKEITDLLQAGEAVFMRVFTFIMYYAPIGFFAYFAVLVSHLGAELIEKYLYVAVLYYLFALAYFIIVYSAYAYIAGKRKGLLLFWQHIFLPMITALATCSSAACIPANLLAAKKMKIREEIVETVIPLGTMIHKEGSIIGGMIKIAFLFGVFHYDFTGHAVYLTAILSSLLVGTVMGAIPSGGMLGELLILSIYGFPSSALIIIAAISIIIDPLATMLNVTGNSLSAMLVERLVGGDHSNRK